jgi:hypothetical protein
MDMKKIGPEIKTLVRSLAILSALLVAGLHAAPAHAINFHSWVSHNGSDANACNTDSPCRSFSRALTQTNDGGEIGCLDSGSFLDVGSPDAFTITISVTINCSGTVAIPNPDIAVICSNPSILINAPGKVVTLRGLNLSGGCQSDGIFVEAAMAVFIEDCVIENFSDKGVVDTRTTGLTKLAIKNTIVRNNLSAGIVVAAAPKNSVVLENVQSVGNTYGIGVATGNNVIINRSVMSENAIAGIEADSGAQVIVDNTEISHNVNYGILASGTVTLANSDISFNTSSISGTIMSYGNNRIFGNGGGTAPTLIGQQ